MAKKKVKKNKKVQIGTVGVDAGLIWVGDPCYIIGKGGKDNPPYKETGKDWGKFCDRLQEKQGNKPYAQFNFDLGHAGLGVCVNTAYGDGNYPVYAEMVDGRIARVWVDFMKYAS